MLCGDKLTVSMVRRAREVALANEGNVVRPAAPADMGEVTHGSLIGRVGEVTYYQLWMSSGAVLLVSEEQCRDMSRPCYFTYW